MIILFVNKYMSFEWIYKYTICLKLNKCNSLKLHKYTVAGCKTMSWVQIYFVECEYMYFLIFALFTNGKPWSRKQVYLLFIFWFCAEHKVHKTKGHKSPTVMIY